MPSFRFRVAVLGGGMYLLTTVLGRRLASTKLGLKVKCVSQLALYGFMEEDMVCVLVFLFSVSWGNQLGKG